MVVHHDNQGEGNEVSVVPGDFKVNEVNPVFCLMSYCTAFWPG